MINQNELHDLGFVLTLLRGDIENPINILVVEKLINIFSDYSDIVQDNSIRNELSKISELDKNKWCFVFTQNFYTNIVIFKNRNINDLFFKSFTRLKELLINSNFEQAYDLVDALHALPNIIAESKGMISNSYWKVFIKPYRLKWEKAFLIAEQKSLSK